MGGLYFSYEYKPSLRREREIDMPIYTTLDLKLYETTRLKVGGLVIHSTWCTSYTPSGMTAACICIVQCQDVSQ